MPKRSRRQLEETPEPPTPETPAEGDEYIESRDESMTMSAAESDNGAIDDLDLSNIVNQMLRVILARELRGSLIRREHLSAAISGHTNKGKYSYDMIMTKVKGQLETVYGLTLREVPKLDSKAAKQPLVLVNCLTEHAKDVLGDIWSQGLNISSDTKNELRVSKLELQNSGILLAILGMIIIHSNNVTEQELYKSLRRFGISSSETEKIPQFNVTGPELLADFIKRDYLIKENGNKGSSHLPELIFYKIGRRSLVEFDAISLIKFVQAVYGPHFNDIVLHQIVGIIEKVYLLKLEQEDINAFLETSPEAPLVSDSQTPTA